MDAQKYVQTEMKAQNNDLDSQYLLVGNYKLFFEINEVFLKARIFLELIYSYELLSSLALYVCRNLGTQMMGILCVVWSFIYNITYGFICAENSFIMNFRHFAQNLIQALVSSICLSSSLLLVIARAAAATPSVSILLFRFFIFSCQRSQNSYRNQYFPFQSFLIIMFFLII